MTPDEPLRPGSASGDDSASEREVLLSAFASLLPVEDAAASVLGAPFDIETLAASSVRAARLDEAQIDLGEGPAWDAYRSCRPVSLQLDDDRDPALWPMFAPRLLGARVRTVFAVPLIVGRTSIGAVSLYSSHPVHLDGDQLRDAQHLAGLFARAEVAQAVREADSVTVARDPALSRREVHQATGMVIAQTGTTPADALDLIRAHAFAAGMSVRDVAALILARTLTFSIDDR